MSRLLSQEEVDALLASFEPGEEEVAEGAAREVVFDLRAPIVLAGDRLALVEAAAERIAEELGEILDIMLAPEKSLEVTYAGLVQQPASTVLATMTPLEPLGVVLDEERSVVGGISLHGELAVMLVDRLQGGEGRAPEGARLLSPVEQRLLETALARITGWLSARTALGPIESGGLDHDPVFGRLARRGGTLATAQLRVSTETRDLPCRLLMTPVLVNRLVAETPVVREDAPPGELVEAVGRARVRIEPVLAAGTIRLGDLRRLRPGAVLQLEATEEDRLGLRINDLFLARGEISRRGAQRWFEVKELAEGPEGIL